MCVDVLKEEAASSHYASAQSNMKRLGVGWRNGDRETSNRGNLNWVLSQKTQDQVQAGPPVSQVLVTQSGQGYLQEASIQPPKPSTVKNQKHSPHIYQEGMVEKRQLDNSPEITRLLSRYWHTDLIPKLGLFIQYIRTPSQVVAVAVQSLSCVWLFATPWTVAHQAPLTSTISQSLFKFMSIELVMLSNHLILCRSLLLFPNK